ncbi:Alpha/Beta hydrolase protein, partial [Infundibulicybe gibba]
MMLAFTAALLFPALLLPLARATPFAPVHKRFASTLLDDVNLRFVSDSGVCETTPGVHQMSGYIDVGTNMSMWFWFFEARESPETAPLPCGLHLSYYNGLADLLVMPVGIILATPSSADSCPVVIYIDQPIGTGFSHGIDTVNSTEAAAPFVWTAFQVLFESGQFSKFQSREFIFATESYGGHYGPSFVTYFDQQNALIQSGSLQGEQIIVSALMINNGWYDPLIQNQAYVDFATNAPGYGPLQSASGPGSGMLCAGNSAASNKICENADNFC